MNNPFNFKTEDLRDAIQESYGELACDPNQEFHFSIGKDLALKVGYDAEILDRLPNEAVNSFAGVGNPFAIRPLERGATVVDIGSGAGMDVCVASQMVGPTGCVYGIEMTEEMIDSARKSVKKLRAPHVSFINSYAESIPLPDQIADVVISNGVINLCPDKEQVYREIYRILKPGGHIQIADVMLQEEVSIYAKDLIHLWTDCVAGGITDLHYKEILDKAGFESVYMFDFVKVFEGSQVEAYAEKYGAFGVHIYAVKPDA